MSKRSRKPSLKFIENLKTERKENNSNNSCGISNDLNWASEASPTLGCSIEISRDIYIYVHVSVVVQKA